MQISRAFERRDVQSQKQKQKKPFLVFSCINLRSRAAGEIFLFNRISSSVLVWAVFLYILTKIWWALFPSAQNNNKESEGDSEDSLNPVHNIEHFHLVLSHRWNKEICKLNGLIKIRCYALFFCISKWIIVIIVCVLVGWTLFLYP